MFYQDLTSEDSRLIAMSESGDKYTVKLNDLLSGKSHICVAVSSKELAAITYLMTVDHSEIPKDLLYSLCEESETALKGCPIECRPIP